MFKKCLLVGLVALAIMPLAFDFGLTAAIISALSAAASTAHQMSQKPPEEGMRGGYRPSQYLPWNKQEPSQSDLMMQRRPPQPDIMSFLSKFIPRSY